MHIFSLILMLLPLVGLFCCYLFYAQENLHSQGNTILQRMCSENSCALLVTSKYYHVFYFPNWYYGIAYYLLVVIALVSNNRDLLLLALAGAVAAFCLSLYLIWALVIKLKTVCKVCYTAHVVNTLLIIGLSLFLFQ
jgi:uncharacterized membrane protein